MPNADGTGYYRFALDDAGWQALIENAADVGDSLTRELGSRVDSHGAIGDVRGCGLFISVEMIKDANSKEPDAALANTLSDRLKDKGFLASYSGKFNNVLKIRPPLVFSHANADEFLVAFDECMAEISE